MWVRVGENQVQKAVAIQVPAVDAFDGSPLRDVNTRARIREAPLREIFEAVMYDLPRVRSRQQTDGNNNGA